MDDKKVNKARQNFIQAVVAWRDEKTNEPQLLLTGLDKGLYHSLQAFLPLLINDALNKSLTNKVNVLEAEVKNLTAEKKNLSHTLKYSLNKLENSMMNKFLEDYQSDPDYKYFLSSLVDRGLVDVYTLTNNLIKIEWVIGGTGGGSCWDTGEEDNHYSIDGSPEPEFDMLDKIIENYYPNISMLKYKKMIRECVDVSERYCNEYYGNSTTYAVKTLNLPNFYKFLVEEKVYDV